MDLIFRNGTVVTANDVYQAGVASDGGVIKRIGSQLPSAAKREVDVAGKLLVPGGVDVHTHCETEFLGEQRVDDWYSASAGGERWRDHCRRLRADQSGPIDDRMPAAVGGPRQVEAIIDYGLHPTLMKPSDELIAEMRDVVAEGYTSFKIFMIGFAAFDEYSVQYAKAMAEAGRLGALINIHCEDQTCISFHTQRLEAAGHSDIRHFADSRPPFAEGIAVQRAIHLARMTDAPIYMVHLS